MIASGERVQSLGEEIANSVSHRIGLLTAAATAPVLLADAVQQERLHFHRRPIVFGIHALPRVPSEPGQTGISGA